jgi:hypothetical protein
MPRKWCRKMDETGFCTRGKLKICAMHEDGSCKKFLIHPHKTGKSFIKRLIYFIGGVK